MSKAPAAFQFYPDDFLGGVISMSAEERGVFITLLAMAWNRGNRLTDSVERLALACASSVDVVKSVLEYKFSNDGDGWRNERLEQVRLEQAKYRESKSEAGKRGAAKRWQDDGSAIADAWQCHSSAIDVPLANDSPPSPSPTPTPSRIDVESKTTIDIDQGKFGEIERRAVAVCKALRAKSVGDRLLAWRCAVLASTSYSEHWLFDAVTAVEQGKSKRKPWAYFTRCLREGAKAIDRDFDSDCRAVPAPPETVMELMRA